MRGRVLPVIRRFRRFGRPSVALLGGALTTLSIPPMRWWFLAPLGVSVLMFALSGVRARARRAALALVWAAALYVPSLWWMTQFSVPGGIGVGVLEATISALTIAVLARTTTPRSTALTVPGALVVADALRSLWPFGGLPLGGIDLGQADGPLAWFAMLGGRLLIVGLVGALGAAAFLFVRSEAALARRNEPNRPARAIAVGILGALVVPAMVSVDELLLRRLPTGTYTTGLSRIAVVQGGGPRGLRASVTNALRTYDLTQRAHARIDGRVDLVLWPENIVDVDSIDARASALPGSTADTTLSGLAREERATLIAGITEDTSDGKQFVNYSVAYGPDGERGAMYEKVRRVPFGEFFPFRATIERLGLADLPSRDARAGTEPGVLRTPAGNFAVLISYEGFFDDRARGGVRAGGEAVLIPTNAASYSSGHLPAQQVAAAKLRAIETGRWVAQASTTGYSLIIDERGRILRRSRLGRSEVLRADLGLRGGLTPYARFNDVPALALAALALAIGWWPRLRNGPSDHAPDPNERLGPHE